MSARVRVITSEGRVTVYVVPSAAKTSTDVQILRLDPADYRALQEQIAPVVEAKPRRKLKAKVTKK